MCQHSQRLPVVVHTSVKQVAKVIQTRLTYQKNTFFYINAF